MELSRVIFWDTDYDQIDWEKHARYVIQKVVCFGTLEDWKKILKFYGKDRIKKEAVQIRDLDPVSMNFLSVFFNISKEEFRCYIERQYLPQLYEY